MKLASLRSDNRRNRNGDLVVVSRDNRRAIRPDRALATTLLEAVQNWGEIETQLRRLSDELNAGKAVGAFDLDVTQCLAPLTNAPGFYDGSAFLSHVYRARKARGDEMPASAKVTPLMYQGVSDNQLPAGAPIDLMDAAFGGDFEGELAAITGDVPKGTRAEDASRYVLLLTLFNDITYREIVKSEIQSKFGFLQSKPNSAFAPFVVTPDELGGHWDGARVSAEISIDLNGQPFGHPHGREMHFTFPQLVAHACRTRPLSAGSIVGTGTFSNEDKSVGFACLTEKRFQEVIESGKATTGWLKPGDRVKMEMILDGNNIFGTIDQTARV